MLQVKEKEIKKETICKHRRSQGVIPPPVNTLKKFNGIVPWPFVSSFNIKFFISLFWLVLRTKYIQIAKIFNFYFYNFLHLVSKQRYYRFRGISLSPSITLIFRFERSVYSEFLYRQKYTYIYIGNLDVFNVLVGAVYVESIKP